MKSNYQALDIAVPGGQLRVGVWDSPDVAAGAAPHRTVLALHGITASHRTWTLIADALTAAPATRVIAPDLRGRGRSAHLPGPWGMPRHADDAAAVLETLGSDRVTVIGHSMGAFAAVVFAHRHRDHVESLLLVDGGPPLPLPAGMTAEQYLAATLGPAEARLRMTFPSRSAYRQFWQQHPALGADWNPAIEDYVDYDLTGTEPELRSSCDYHAIAADSAELAANESLLAAWDALSVQARLLRAPRDLLDEPPGLYPEAALVSWRERFPRFTWRTIDDVNHYTITLGPTGAAAVAAEIAIPQAPEAGHKLRR